MSADATGPAANEATVRIVNGPLVAPADQHHAGSFILLEPVSDRRKRFGRPPLRIPASRRIHRDERSSCLNACRG